MSAFESRVSFQETSKFYSLVLHRVLTKSDRLPARLLCAGASPSGSTQPNQTDVFLCSACVDAQVFPCPSSQPCVCSGTFKMWTFGKVQWAATTTGVKSTESSESIFMPKLLRAAWKKSSPLGLTARRMDRQTDKILMFIKGGHAWPQSYTNIWYSCTLGHKALIPFRNEQEISREAWVENSVWSLTSCVDWLGSLREKGDEHLLSKSKEKKRKKEVVSLLTPIAYDTVIYCQYGNLWFIEK